MYAIDFNNTATKLVIPVAAERGAGYVVKLSRYPEKALRSLDSCLRRNDGMINIRSLFFPTFPRGAGPYGPEAPFRLPNFSRCPMLYALSARNPHLVTRNSYHLTRTSQPLFYALAFTGRIAFSGHI